MNDTINFPIKTKTSTDCPTIILKLKYVGKQPWNNHSPIITITNAKSFNLAPYQCLKMSFPIMVLSSLPAKTIVYASELVYRLGLHTLESIIPTNDMPLYITVYNPTSSSLTFKKDSLQFYCTTILSCQFRMNFPFALIDEDYCS